MLWNIVEVSYCQYNFAAILADCIVLYSAELAPVVSSLQNPLPYLLPILRVSSFVFRFNWHIGFD